MDPLIDRHKSLTEVVSTGRRFARSTARALKKLVTPVQEEGRPLPDFAYAKRLLAAALERRWDRLAADDEALNDAEMHRHALIDQRDGEVQVLRREVVDLRLVLRGRFGAEPAKNFSGLRGETSYDPVVLQRQADRAVTRLRDLSRPLPAARLRTSGAMRLRWAAPVADGAEALRATVTRVIGSFKRVDFVRLERQRALADFNDSFVTVAGWFEAVYRLVGRHDLADRVRPSKKYPGLTFLRGKKRLGRKAGRKKRRAEAEILSFPRLEPVLRFFGSRQKSS